MSIPVMSAKELALRQRQNELQAERELVGAEHQQSLRVMADLRGYANHDSRKRMQREADALARRITVLGQKIREIHLDAERARAENSGAQVVAVTPPAPRLGELPIPPEVAELVVRVMNRDLKSLARIEAAERLVLRLYGNKARP